VLFRSIMSEISDVKEMVGTALKNSSEAIERYREIEAKIEELPRANFIRAEITAQITEEVGRIAKMDKRIKCLEQDMIKTSFKGGNGGSVGAQRNFDYSAIERIEEEIAQLHHKNLHFSSKKVDLHVLEELMRHVATREDLRKITRQTNALLKQHQKHTANNTEGSESISVLESRLMDRIDKQFYDGALESRMHASIHSKIEAYVCLNVSRISKSISEIQNLVTSSRCGKHEVDGISVPQSSDAGGMVCDDDVYNRLRRDFDEKLYLVCSDLAECKAAWQHANRNTFNRSGCWLWNSASVKLGSTVPWNVESCNTDPDNFLWNQNSTHIKVVEAGLYQISFAFFTKSKPSVQLVINGESVLSAINSPSYVIHHGSGFISDGTGRMREGSVTGLSLVDYLALPSRSSVALHYHGKKSGHGFLSLRRM